MLLMINIFFQRKSRIIKERRVIALEKQVKLKEEELEMRRSNPEAFAQDIVIVNDIEEAKEHYKVKQDKYATN